MARFELDLLENAIDSLNEALAKYQQGLDGNGMAFKFCVQHLSHFLELVLKYYVTQSHPLLIYKNPFAKDITEESQTIGLFEAINFLKNEGHEIPDKFESDLRWLKKLRNGIEHHKFSMKLEEVQDCIGRLMSAVVAFDESHDILDLSAHISKDQYDLFHELANTYEGRVKKAKQVVEDYISGCDPSDDDCHVYHCYECDHDTIIPCEESSTGYRCTFCGNEESDDIEVRCGLCDLTWPVGLMESVDWGDTGKYEYCCPRCRHDPEYVKDD